MKPHVGDVVGGPDLYRIDEGVKYYVIHGTTNPEIYVHCDPKLGYIYRLGRTGAAVFTSFDDADIYIAEAIGDEEEFIAEELPVDTAYCITLV